jgi:methionyl-tRNA synthetase
MQLYCDTCQRFLADRLVEGICPNKTCNALARGDQCEICSTMLNPTELIEPKCKVRCPVLRFFLSINTLIEACIVSLSQH